MYTLAQILEIRLCHVAELLAQRGLDNVRAHELARATRLSVGSLYRYYGSKQGIARAIRTLTERELAYASFVAYAMADESPRAQDFRDVFFPYWCELATWAVSQPHLVGFTFLHNHPDTDPPGEHDGRTRAQLLEVLKHGERAGAFPKGRTWIHECMVWGVMAELVRRAGRGEEVSDEDIQTTGEALWRALSPDAHGNSRGGGIPPPGEVGLPRDVLESPSANCVAAGASCDASSVSASGPPVTAACRVGDGDGTHDSRDAAKGSGNVAHSAPAHDVCVGPWDGVLTARSRIRAQLPDLPCVPAAECPGAVCGRDGMGALGARLRCFDEMNCAQPCSGGPACCLRVATPPWGTEAQGARHVGPGPPDGVGA